MTSQLDLKIVVAILRRDFHELTESADLSLDARLEVVRDITACPPTDPTRHRAILHKRMTHALLMPSLMFSPPAGFVLQAKCS